MENVAHILLQKKIRPSVQRVKVLSYLLEKRNHPTVDMIYTELHPQMPTLSRTTVYNTLELFRENQLVNTLDFGEGSLRYDAFCSPHCHFECEECGQVFDIETPPPAIDGLVPSGFSLSRTSLYLYGKCRGCRRESTL